jgi:crotonobetainyl-CoA:carnitine CoA-transferase CaiB-like acyl-CoA transferase
MHTALVAAYESGIALPADRDAELVRMPPLSEADRGYLAATLPVMALASGSVAAYAMAANRFRRAVGLAPMTHTLDPAFVTAAFAGERMLRIDGRPVAGFAELSGFFEAADGLVRTHANYPHHRRRLLRSLDLPEDADRAAAVARFAELPAAEIEHRAAEHDAVAVRVRSETDWASSEPGRAAARGPLVELTARTDRGPTSSPGSDTSRSATASSPTLTPLGRTAAFARLSWSRSATASSPTLTPLAGIRVLDLTRVLAGPVATRALALLGAQVLRIDPPWLPEIAWQHLDTGQGKRTALLDVRADPARARELLRTADVLVTGYRPDAAVLAELAPADTRPGVVVARVSAWGNATSQTRRRGFDSVVQAAGGISLIEGAPGALPAQALDHASGYLLAAGVIDALAARHRDGLGRDVRVALARTAAWLLAAPGRDPDHPAAALPDARTTVRHGNRVTARPALVEYPDYPWPAHPHGADPTVFADKT